MFGVDFGGDDGEEGFPVWRRDWGGVCYFFAEGIC
jgi:hypothetical protein